MEGVPGSTKRLDLTSGDIVGNGFVFVKITLDKVKHRRALFICHCGKEHECRLSPVVTREKKSCGCMGSPRHFKHGASKTREFRIWTLMVSRCTKPSNKRFHRYGGRGIKVCESWRRSFKNFIEDMGNAPSDKHSIDRIDNDGNHEPSNCKWSTYIEQANNTSRNKRIELNGVTMTISQWARQTGINEKTISHRLRKGLSPSLILKTKNHE